MMIKALIFAFLATVVLGEYQHHFTPEQHQQFKDVLKQQCRRYGAEDKAEDVENSIKSFAECVTGLFNAKTLKNEIEEAKPNGNLDEVFKKYCDKSPQIKGCFHALSNGMSPCVDPKMRENIPAANNATDQLIDFVCYKDGDRIALFIAEGGPECFQEKSTQLRECANKIREGSTSVSPSATLNFLFETNGEIGQSWTIEQQCNKYDEATSCVVTALESCTTPTPANMAESLFRFIRNSYNCPKKQ